ncbi:hypothetical protein M011DRAFT_465592 [Sporormia fimetaria CBS 119925]|uniref:Pre-mRNA-splicing factor n=1 Tax=Sporormia fimetaria CBS 119925 TaxID=1340428 RepID=A0A6A6VJQ0_9PLEO|nr:hypothetical protein M011DRAFT_465592 [Sporormia fimetaria CBS 119925]
MSAPPSNKPAPFKLSFASAKQKAPNGSALSTKSSGSALEPPAKRPRLLGDDEPEDQNTSVEITGWDTATGGAINADGKGKEEKKPLVIPVLPNRNWRDVGRRKDGEGGDLQKGEEKKGEEKHPEEEEEVSYGLTFIKKKEDTGTTNGAVLEETQKQEDDGLTEEQRLEKRALAALLDGKAPAEQTVIPIASEEEAFEHDFHSAPDAPSLDDYAAVPVEGFGAALLRGMGWKDGEEIGRKRGAGTVKPREVKRRAEFLGIGAKEEAIVGGRDVQGWAKGMKEGKPAATYNPVLVRNKVTGELLTEEEMKAKLEQQKVLEEGEGGRDEGEEEKRREEKDRKRRDRNRRDRDRSRSPNADSRRKDYERSRDSRDRRDRGRDEESRRSDRDRRRGDEKYKDDYDLRKRDSRRRDYDYSDDDRRREKRRDKERERERRDRSRSRDSEDRRKRRRDYDDDTSDRKKRYRDEGRRDRDRDRR